MFTFMYVFCVSNIVLFIVNELYGYVSNKGHKK